MFFHNDFYLQKAFPTIVTHEPLLFPFIVKEISIFPPILITTWFCKRSSSSKDKPEILSLVETKLQETISANICVVEFHIF